MSRLFWKIFLGFWLTLVLMGVGVGVLVYVHNQQRLAEFTDLAAGPWAERNVVAVATALQYGGTDAVKQLAAQWPGRRPLPVLVIDGDGRDLLGRPVPAAALDRARALLRGSDRAPGVRRVRSGGRNYILFMPSRLPLGRSHRHHRFGHDPFAVRLGIALLASILFSAGLSWYLTLPLRRLRRAAGRLAEGALDTRVMPELGRRRDEIGELGRDFDHMAGRLQALVGAQKRLLHDVSHELRSPLARLQVAVGLARQQPDKVGTALQRVERETGRLDDLVGQLLSLSRLEAGVVGGSEQYLDVAELLAAIVEDARFEAQANGRKVELAGAAEAVVKGRPELLRRAFENVIRNAVRYTAPGTTVDVRLDRRANDQGLRISVCDQGPGVKEDQLGALFEPFVRVTAQDASEAAAGGFGLGLAIAKRAIEAHGGTVAAHNRTGGGLCVTITLPLAADFTGDAEDDSA